MTAVWTRCNTWSLTLDGHISPLSNPARQSRAGNLKMTLLIDGLYNNQCIKHQRGWAGNSIWMDTMADISLWGSNEVVTISKWLNLLMTLHDHHLLNVWDSEGAPDVVLKTSRGQPPRVLALITIVRKMLTRQIIVFWSGHEGKTVILSGFLQLIFSFSYKHTCIFKTDEFLKWYRYRCW